MFKENKYKRVVFLVDPEDYQKLQIKLLKSGKKVSTWFREGIKEWVK